MIEFLSRSLNWFPNDHIHSFVSIYNNYQPWIYSIFGAFLIGIAGIFPLAFIPVDYGCKRKVDSFNLLHLVLSFAVGGLLSDVFLHLLPEAWTTAIEGGATPQEAFSDVGLCVLGGIFLFIIVEMLASADKNVSDAYKNNNMKNSFNDSCNNNSSSSCNDKIKVIGYLNLIANGIDNFTHGLAVAGSFLVSYKTGVLTTAAILIHEVPHEIGDFAILLNSGFSRWEAAKAQIYTASIGLVGAVITLILGTSHFLGGIQVYVLGFTAGGFLNIALVSVLPDLLREDRPSHSVVQLMSLLLGIVSMALVTFIC